MEYLFDKIYKEGNPAWGYQPALFLKEQVFKFPPNATILDVGCGTGRNAYYLAEQGFNVHAIDNSTEAIKQATNKDSNVFFELKDLEEQNWSDKTYDVVIDFGYFHQYTSSIHVEDTKKQQRLFYHKQLSKVLKDGGIYINQSGHNRLDEEFIPGPGKTEYLPDNPYNFQPPTVEKHTWKEFDYLNIEILDDTVLPANNEWGEYPCWNVFGRKMINT